MRTSSLYSLLLLSLQGLSFSLSARSEATQRSRFFKCKVARSLMQRACNGPLGASLQFSEIIEEDKSQRKHIKRKRANKSYNLNLIQ